MANLLRELRQGLAALHQDLGDRMEDIVVVTMSEFGRTAHENGNRGTDHGHANCMFVMGGPVQGRQSVRQLARPRHRSNSTKAATWRSPPISAPCSAKSSADTWAATICARFSRDFDNSPAKFPGLLKA